MNRRITEHELERRQMIARAKTIMTEAMEDAPELYYSEWLHVFQEMQNRLISDMLRDDWAEQEAGE